MPALDERIKAAAEKLRQLKAQQQKADAKKRAEDARRKRADDTRRKILAGAWLLERMAHDPQTHAHTLAQLDGYLTRPDDRALFGLATPIDNGNKTGKTLDLSQLDR